MTKYYPGDKYQVGDRIITYRYREYGRVYFAEDGERKSMPQKAFYSLKPIPLEPVGNMTKIKPLMTKSQYKKRNQILYVD